MREIKFRGYSTILKSWLYGYPIGVGSQMCIVQENDFEKDGHHVHPISDTPMWVEKETVGEFTGKLDKNGKEIYESDIVRKVSKISGDVMCIGHVVYDNKKCIFCIHGNSVKTVDFNEFDTIDNGNCTIVHYFEFEVVGNVFDNPNLLNQES